MNHTYRPGVGKLVLHPEHMAALVHKDFVGPLHISIWPTSNCQLSCRYCCVRNEKEQGELSLQDFISAIDALIPLGLKAVEFSGGGEPLLWPHLPEAVRYARDKGMRLSLITNGIAIPLIDGEILSCFSWVRISVQSYYYMKTLDISDIAERTKISYSYVTDSCQELRRLHELCDELGRVCRVTTPKPCEEDLDFSIQSYIAGEGLYTLLFTHKKRGAALGCYMPWIRAAIDWRGWLLPCPAMHTSQEYSGAIPHKFRLCKINDIAEWYRQNRVVDIGYRCTFCNCGKENNDYLYRLLGGLSDDDYFV